MIYRFGAISEPPFTDFISDDYKQLQLLYPYPNDVKRFMLLHKENWNKFIFESWKNNPNIHKFIDKDPFKKVSLKETWKPIEIRFYSKAKARKVGEISSLVSSNSPIFSQRALDVLGDLLEENGEFLELNCVSDGKVYYLYHVLNYVDILDPYKSGDIKGNSCFYWYFKENVDFDKLNIFRVISPNASSSNYLSKKFMERCIKNKLTGIVTFNSDIPFIPDSVTNKNQLESYKNLQDIIYQDINKPLWYKKVFDK